MSGLGAADFLKGLDAANAAVLQAAERGMVKASMRLLNDCVMEQPTAPLDEGTLRGSGSVVVNGKTLSGDGAAQKPASGDIVGQVGFNTPYAAKLHEHPEYDFTDPGSGGKYLETKLARNQQRYMGIVAAEVKGALG